MKKQNEVKVEEVVAPLAFNLEQLSAFSTASREEIEDQIEGKDLTSLVTATCSVQGAVTGGARMVATHVCMTVDGDWTDCLSTDKATDLGRAFEKVRKVIVQTAKARNHSNPSQLVKQIKEQGKKLLGIEPVTSALVADKRGTNYTPFERIARDFAPIYKAYAIPSSKQEAKLKVDLTEEHFTRLTSEIGPLIGDVLKLVDFDFSSLETE